MIELAAATNSSQLCHGRRFQHGRVSTLLDLPNRMFVFKGENCTGGKHAKERLSAAFTVNATGSQKLLLLVIGRYMNQRRLNALRRHIQKQHKGLDDGKAI